MYYCCRLDSIVLAFSLLLPPFVWIIVQANAILMLGHNLIGFEDEDFSAQNYRHKESYLHIKMKSDQKNIKKMVEGAVK